MLGLASSSELRFGLRLFEDRLHLGRLHHVALDLQFAAHEQLLGVGFSGNEPPKVGIAKDQRDYTMY